MLGKLTSRAIMHSPLAVWGTYVNEETGKTTRLKVMVNHNVERWDGRVVTRTTEIVYQYFDEHPLRRHSVITIGSQDYQITEVISDDGFLITSAVKKVQGVCE